MREDFISSGRLFGKKMFCRDLVDRSRAKASTR